MTQAALLPLQHVPVHGGEGVHRIRVGPAAALRMTGADRTVH